ncbi:MAG: hypothetical protein Q4C33_02585 [bacterium]|nr:hypothetical protein [bacterium]
MMKKSKNSETERRIRRKVFLRLLKKSIKPKNLIFLIIILSANTFAWFVYVKEVHTDINVKVRAWNVVLTNSESEVVNTINIDITSAYPGMEEFSNETKVYNQGESKADFKYTILSVNAFGNEIFTSEKIIADGGTPTDENPTSAELESYLKEGIKYPFKIELSASNDKLEPLNGEATFNVKMNWQYESGNDELDTKWGTDAYNYKKNNPDEPGLKIVVELKITQSVS